MKGIVICVAFAFCSIGIFSYADAAGVDVNGKGREGESQKAGRGVSECVRRVRMK